MAHVDAYERLSPLSAALSHRELARRALTIGRATALGVLGDRHAADDVAQEVAITAVRKSSMLRDPAALDAWLHRTATRAALSHARRERRRAVEAASAAEAWQPAPQLRTALELLQGLPPRQRAALTLRYVHDLSDEQIARALGCRRGSVRSLLSRGREAIRQSREINDERGVR